MLSVKFFTFMIIKIHHRLVAAVGSGSVAITAAAAAVSALGSVVNHKSSHL